MKHVIIYTLCFLLLGVGCTSKIDFEVKPPIPPTFNTDMVLSEISTAINTDPAFAGAVSGGRNHYVELFNGTAAAIDLSNYAIGYQASTDLTTLSPWSFTAGNFLVLTGSVAANACYVVASPQANTTAVPSAITWGTTSTTSANASMPLQLSGNSAIALLKRNASGSIVLNGNNYSIIDVFGSPLVARETASGASSARNNFIWSVAGETDTRNRTFMRKKTVTTPTTDWSMAKGTTTTNAQWLVSGDRIWDYSNVGRPTP